ncbi:MAG: hypothetical protein ICV78_03725 [Tolypothrix sp. Co-bin9]|nr:hypothetical protein [Tolypothrix sp. Co-bin9]
MLKEMNISMKDLPLFTEITINEEEKILGAGWFEDATGITTPKPLTDLDKSVRKNYPGGWPGLLRDVVTTAGGGTTTKRTIEK